MSKLSRRRFLKGAALAAGAGPHIVPPSVLGKDAPSNRLNLAIIGIGGRGADNLKALTGQSIVALCDVDDQRAGKAYESHPRAKKFYDFRKMFDEMEKQIDAVVISTPDHTHFHPAWWAMQRGKHVYLEKPLAHSVWEVRELTKLAADKKLATQLGAQRHALAGLRRGVEIIQSGTIGTIKECHSWIASSRGMPAVSKEVQPAPAHLEWDLWLGPAPERPYTKDLAPYNWRFWWDYGTGETGNWACHILDIPYWALGLKHPTRVEGSGPEPDAQRTPRSMATRLEYPATDKRPAVTLHWYQGTPPILKTLGLDGKDMNNLYIGTEGMLLCGFDKTRLLPEEKFKDFTKPKLSLPKTPGFYKEWLNACKGGEPASCNFDYSGPMAESALLANIAYRVQGGFDWDPVHLKPRGNAAAEKYLRTEFRKGWEIA
jgi:predicted dehydrogenase